MNCFVKSFIPIVFLVFVSLPTAAQDLFSSQKLFQKVSLSQNPTQTYNPSVSRLGLQFGTGLLFGAAGGTVGLFGGALVAPNSGGSGGFITLGYAAVGAYVGYTVSSAFGVYMIANSKSYSASLGNILLGHAIGAGVGIGAFALIDSPAVFAIALTTPLIGGIIANNKSIKKRKRMDKTSALLNISNGNTQIDTPSLHLTEIGNFNLIQERTTMVKLLNISL